jgi:hypothetical protein
MGSSSPVRQLRSLVRLLLGVRSSVGHAGPIRVGLAGKAVQLAVSVVMTWALRWALESGCAGHPKMMRERISRQEPIRLATD